MAGASQIRAGEAFVELVIRDKTAAGLRAAQAKLAGFARAITSPTGLILAGVGALLTLVAGAIGKGVSTFLSVSKQLQQIAGIANPKAQALSDAWISLKATMQALFFVIGDAVAGPLTLMIQAMTALILGSVAFASSFVKLGGVFLWIEESFRLLLLGVEVHFMDFIESIASALNLLLPNDAMKIPNEVLEGFRLEIDRQIREVDKVNSRLDDVMRAAKRAADNALQQQGPAIANLGGSAGTFSARGAGLLGIGAGGGMKTSDDETHKLLTETLRVLKALDIGIEFK